MKIVNRETFLKLPAGTLFTKYQPHIFERFAIKGESIGPAEAPYDFYSQTIGDAVLWDSKERFWDLLADAVEKGTSLPMNFQDDTRDELISPNQLYAVFELHDLHALIARLQGIAANLGSKP